MQMPMPDPTAKPAPILSCLSRTEQDRLFPHEPILVGYRGSIAHGMYVPPDDPDSIDDKDIHCIFIAPVEHYLGLMGTRDAYMKGKDVKVNEWDAAIYELRKAAHLLRQCNPNIVSLLWLDDEHYLRVEPAGRLLIENRDLFSSKQAYHTFCGYAHGQLKRMTSFLTPDGGECCAGESLHEPGCPLAQDRGRGSAKKFATGFQGAKRKALVKRFGYDTKNAAHCVRLLRMGIEFLAEGRLHVNRQHVGDADELLAIKRGEWSIDQVRDEASQLFGALKAARDASRLPDDVDRAGIDDLLVHILREALQ